VRQFSHPKVIGQDWANVKLVQFEADCRTICRTGPTYFLVSLDNGKGFRPEMACSIKIIHFVGPGLTGRKVAS